MDDELKKRLDSWKVRPEIPPDFQRGVWRRISLRESESPGARFFGIWAIQKLSVLQLAAFAIVLGAFAGSGFGLIESSRANVKNWKTLEAKYVQSVDPYEHLRNL
jgi:hypothetical protein